MIVRIPVNPDLLVWARETAGYSVADTAARFKKDEEEIRNWESGDTVPTINQLRALAEFYRRPLGVLFRSERPQDRQLPRDFRRTPGTFRVSRQPEVIAELRSAQERREIALDLYQELGEELPPFALSAQLDENPEVVGARIRQALGVTVAEQFRWRDFYVAFNTWRERIEAQNVLVFQFSRIASEKMRGYSLAERDISVIGVNRGEPPQARCFSLLHEFTHLLLRVSGVCDFAEDDQPPEEQRVEIFCNAVAAAALMPMADFLQENLVSPYPRRPRDWDDDTIAALARRYKVSRDATARRLYTANLATREFYVRKHRQYLAEARARKEEQQDIAIGEKGGNKAAALLGTAYGRLVLASYYQDIITLRDVSSYLGMKLSYLGDFERAIGMACRMQSPPQTIYCIDTGSLINPWHKIYQPDMFITIWNNHLPALFESGRLLSSRQVLIEIEKQEDDLCNWCRDRKDYFEEVDETVTRHVTTLMDRYQRLTTAGRNEADPFVVALAMARSPRLTVVAEEGGGMPNARTQNIPFLCQQQGVRCITFNTLLRETGWREGGRR